VTRPRIFLLLDHWSAGIRAILTPKGILTLLIPEVAKNEKLTEMGKGGRTEDVLIDSKVSTAQCKLAVDALLKHALAHQATKEQNELLPDRTEQYVWLIVAVKKMFPERKLKPFKMCVHPYLLPLLESEHPILNSPLSHPLIDPRTTPICLITKDPQRMYKDLLESNDIKFISRVVGIQKLKGKFKPFEARRMLLKENGLFLADDRVIPLLPKLLGKAFFSAKKYVGSFTTVTPR
jgi:ribosome biogenesis protein UTP30